MGDSKPTVIGIDIRVLAVGRHTGVEEYTINLLSHLIRRTKPDENIYYKLFYSARKKRKLNYDWLDSLNVKLYDFNYPSKLIFGFGRFFNRPKIDQLIGGADIFFSPHFFLTPLSESLKRVLVVHDLSFKYFPEFFSFKKRIWHSYLMNVDRQISEANHLFTISESTKTDLIKFYGMDSSKITIVYPGIGEHFRSMANSRESERDKKYMAEKYNLPNKFILYFGTLEPRKNLVGLIKAFGFLKEKYGSSETIKDIKLVLAGNKGWLYRDIYQTAALSTYRKDIIFPGFIDLEDVPRLYKMAEIFVYPSFFEGFGIPLLEAMSSGVPVITCHGSSMPEVVGDAALLVSPYEVGEMCNAMNLILNDSSLRERFIKKGLQRAKTFEWQKSADTIKKILKSKSKAVD